MFTHEAPTAEVREHTDPGQRTTCSAARGAQPKTQTPYEAAGSGAGQREATEPASGQTGNGETTRVSTGTLKRLRWSTPTDGPTRFPLKKSGSTVERLKALTPSSTSKESICPLCANTLRYGLLVILNNKYYPVVMSLHASAGQKEGEDLFVICSEAPRQNMQATDACRIWQSRHTANMAAGLHKESISIELSLPFGFPKPYRSTNIARLH